MVCVIRAVKLILAEEVWDGRLVVDGIGDSDKNALIE